METPISCNTPASVSGDNFVVTSSIACQNLVLEKLDLVTNSWFTERWILPDSKSSSIMASLVT